MPRLEFLSILKYKYARLSKLVNITTHYVAIAHPKNVTRRAFSDLYTLSHAVWRFLPATHYSAAPKYHIESKLKKTCQKHVERNKYTCYILEAFHSEPQ